MRFFLFLNCFTKLNGFSCHICCIGKRDIDRSIYFPKSNTSTAIKIHHLLIFRRSRTMMETHRVFVILYMWGWLCCPCTTTTIPSPIVTHNPETTTMIAATTTVVSSPSPTTLRRTKTTTTLQQPPQQHDIFRQVPLSNFTLELNEEVKDTDLLLQSIQQFIQKGFLWDIYNVTWILIPPDSLSSSYQFHSGFLLIQQEESMDNERIQKEQISLLNDIGLLEYILQQDLFNTNIQIVQIQVDTTWLLSPDPNRNMSSTTLSNAQWIFLSVITAMAGLSFVIILCIRRYRHILHQQPTMQKESSPKEHKWLRMR